MRTGKLAVLFLSSLTVGLVLEAVAAAAEPVFEPVRVTLSGKPAPPASWSVCGFSLVTDRAGPQVVFMRHPPAALASLHPGEKASLAITFRNMNGPFSISARAVLVAGSQAKVSLSLDGDPASHKTVRGGSVTLRVAGAADAGGTTVHLTAWSDGEAAAVRWRNVELTVGEESVEMPFTVDAVDYAAGPPPELPALRPAIEASLIEWDWRMQDGIDTPRAPSDYKSAVRKTLDRGDRLVADLEAQGVALGDAAIRWRQLRGQWQKMQAATSLSEAAWEELWRKVHRLRREIALLNPLAQTGPIALVKRVPSCFSHQITQYYGSCAKPGGGVFVLEQPGRSMRCRQLAAGALPMGSVEHLDVLRDGRHLLFAFCRAETTPKDRTKHLDRFYHLYEVAADGTGLRQLTDGPYDDFAPRYLPNGKIAFVSTRRGGFHRCGRGPCPVYTLALANSDGSDIRTISFHETHEWDPAVLNDGRLIYTRWDYVDRDAVHYQQLWTVRPDGTDVRIFFGNNTFNPVGIWEASPVPGSNRVMATAAAHHAMTAGSIILLDVNQGVDGLGPITRLTPDAPFPESETPLYQSEKGAWRAAKGASQTPPAPIESQRWPGHCYRTPFPLSETYFLAAYSFDRLIGEPTYNRANMFGLYLVDAFGNKELLYRDLNISSLWPVPLAPRPAPPDLPSVRDLAGDAHGFFLLQDVYRSWPKLPDGTIERLRIVQVLPKSTPHINQPRVGAANASPGKQVLGTVPVEADGSAYFRAPAGVPLAFQALDAEGQAVQIMRSLTYLQPGETVACIGCHEHRQLAPAVGGFGEAFSKPAADIEPGPEGSQPLSYPRLVQPVLDRHCVACHNREKPGGDVVLTDEPEGPFTASYNALIGLVSFPAWGNGDNSEPLSRPGYFGARGSRLTTLLRDGHYDVKLPPEDWERLITWMDANALFYGTFDVEDQQRQRRGERIRGPAIE